MAHAEIAIIGAGIAGASLAAHLAETTSVIVLEAEDRPGYHATGRSAAMFLESYGPPPVRAATRASRAFLDAPPDRFSRAPLLTARGFLAIAEEAEREELATLVEDCRADGIEVAAIDADTACRMVPALRRERVATAMQEPAAREIDVAALHDGYLRLARHHGGQIAPRAEATEIAWTGGHWRIVTRTGEIEAGIVVDAAGAWADTVAGMAGAAPLAIQPKRRSVLAFDPVTLPAGAEDWPLVDSFAERFYFKPEAGGLLLSPADATDQPPADARPEDEDIARAIAELEAATTLQVARIRARWAGLRSFAPDEVPVVGWDGDREAFFWLAGQGGYGIQTAPALAELAANLIFDRPTPGRLTDCGADAAQFAPARFDRSETA